MTLISTSTFSDAASVSITSGIDSTYKLYIFKFIDIHPEYDGAKLRIQFNVAGQSGYNETVTSTFFDSEHSEADDAATLGYKTSVDQAQSTGEVNITREIGNDNATCAAGTLWLFDPSNTTYVTHFYSRFSEETHHPYHMDCFVGGYVNATGAVDEVQFTVETDNLSGTIKLYGVG